MHARKPRERESTHTLAEPPASAVESPGGFSVGYVTRINADGSVLVASSGKAPVRAHLVGTLDQRQVERAQRDGELAVLAFPRGGGEPLVLALTPAPCPSSRPRHERAPDAPPSSLAEPIELSVDGRRLRIRAEDEIVFECGKASVTLRRNGKIVIRGTHIETCSEGANRIKGGHVRIN